MTEFPVSARPSAKGWCPSVLQPMPAADGLIARITPQAARLSAWQAARLADAAARYGSGALELTRRGNIQARGFAKETYSLFVAEMIAGGLAPSDDAPDWGVAVLAGPLSPGEDPSCAFDAVGIVRAIQDKLVDQFARTGRACDLPAKTGIVVDGGGILPVSQNHVAPLADVTISPAPDDGAILALALGPGKAALIPVEVDDVADAVIALFKVFVKKARPDARRVGVLADEIGTHRLFKQAGLAAPALISSPSTVQEHPRPGIVALTEETSAVVIAAPFGRLNAGQLGAIAQLARASGDTTIRVTPWRSLVLPGADAGDAMRMLEEASALGFITVHDDPRLRIAVCTGAPRCAQAHADTLGDARRFAEYLPEGVALHVSGCAKGCAQTAPVEITLRAVPNGYDVIRNGTAHQAADEAGISTDQVIGLLEGQGS